MERDYRNRSLGKAGEEFVVDLERRQLIGADRPDLARKIRWVAAEDGDGAGYDVLSFDSNGHERLLEVENHKRGCPDTIFSHSQRVRLINGAPCGLAYLSGSPVC